MSRGVLFLTRVLSIVAALAVTVVVVCFPRLIAVDMHKVMSGKMTAQYIKENDKSLY